MTRNEPNPSLVLPKPNHSVSLCLSDMKKRSLCWHWKWHKANKRSVSDTKDPKDKHVWLNKWITCSPWQSSFLHLWDFGVCQVLTATPSRVNGFGGEGVCWLILFIWAESLVPSLQWSSDSICTKYDSAASSISSNSCFARVCFIRPRCLLWQRKQGHTTLFSDWPRGWIRVKKKKKTCEGSFHCRSC